MTINDDKLFMKSIILQINMTSFRLNNITLLGYVNVAKSACSLPLV